MKHVHYDMIVEWAKDTSRVLQSSYCSDDIWNNEEVPIWHPHKKYRFKPAEPKFIVVNGVNVPEPVREPLEDGEWFWVADAASNWVGGHKWSTTYSGHKSLLSLGLIHMTREAAQAHIDAMLLPSRTDK